MRLGHPLTQILAQGFVRPTDACASSLRHRRESVVLSRASTVAGGREREGKMSEVKPLTNYRLPSKLFSSLLLLHRPSPLTSPARRLHRRCYPPERSGLKHQLTDDLVETMPQELLSKLAQLSCAFKLG